MRLEEIFFVFSKFRFIKKLLANKAFKNANSFQGYFIAYKMYENLKNTICMQACIKKMYFCAYHAERKNFKHFKAIYNLSFEDGYKELALIELIRLAATPKELRFTYFSAGEEFKEIILERIKELPDENIEKWTLLIDIVPENQKPEMRAKHLNCLANHQERSFTS